MRMYQGLLVAACLVVLLLACGDEEGGSLLSADAEALGARSGVTLPPGFDNPDDYTTDPSLKPGDISGGTISGGALVAGGDEVNASVTLPPALHARAGLAPGKLQEDYVVGILVFDQYEAVWCKFSHVEGTRIFNGGFTIFPGTNYFCVLVLTNTKKTQPPYAPAVRSPFFKAVRIAPARLVFYTNDYYEPGMWRYLEAAPKGWAGDEVDPEGAFSTSTSPTAEGGGIGDGADNSVQLIDDPSIGGLWGTLTNCRIHGFSNWHLPSIGELAVMYTNLHQQIRGGFSSGEYWSSTVFSGSVSVISFGNGNYTNKGHFGSSRFRPARLIY